MLCKAKSGKKAQLCFELQRNLDNESAFSALEIASMYLFSVIPLLISAA